MYKTLLKIFILLGVAAYLIFALVTFNRPVEGQDCVGLDIVIDDNYGTGFIGENEVREWLVSHAKFPEGEKLTDIDLAEMEQVLEKNPYIDHALCYTTAEDKVAIRVTPRIPLLHVINQKGEDFYIDNQGGTMPRGHHTIDLLVVTGNVPRSTAGALYSPMARIISNDSLWSSQIQEIHVDADGEISLTPKGANHIVILGDTSNVADKLSRLAVFYDEGLSKAGWNIYKTISLKYDNQVIATKR